MIHRPALLALLLALLLAAAQPVAAAAPAPDVPAAAALDDARTQALYLSVIGKLHGDGKSHAALAYLDDFDRRYPASAAARLLRADCLLAIGDLANAAALYRALLATSRQAAAESGLGQIAAASGDWRAAAAAYRRAVALDPVNAAYRNDLGYALLKSGDARQALFMLRQATELDPASPLIRNNLHLAETRLKDAAR